MKVQSRVAVIFAISALGGLGILSLAVWPGVLEMVVLTSPLICLTLPLVGCWFFLLMALGLRDLVSMLKPDSEGRRWGLWSAILMFATIGLVWFHIPQRLVFIFCYAGLNEFLEAPPTEGLEGDALGRRIGPYWMDRYGADARGGVYFRTHIGPDGIGPDHLSSGFAFRPNRQGTPFGDARYRLRRLFGEWYAFAASNDW